jgi:hypothetical protein
MRFGHGRARVSKSKIEQISEMDGIAASFVRFCQARLHAKASILNKVMASPHVEGGRELG